MKSRARLFRWGRLPLATYKVPTSGIVPLPKISVDHRQLIGESPEQRVWFFLLCRPVLFASPSLNARIVGYRSFTPFWGVRETRNDVFCPPAIPLSISDRLNRPIPSLLKQKCTYPPKKFFLIQHNRFSLRIEDGGCISHFKPTPPAFSPKID